MFAALLRRRSEPGLLAQYMQVSTFDPSLGFNFLRCCVLHLLVGFEVGHCSEGQTGNSIGQIHWEVLSIWLDWWHPWMLMSWVLDWWSCRDIMLRFLKFRKLKPWCWQFFLDCCSPILWVYIVVPFFYLLHSACLWKGNLIQNWMSNFGWWYFLEGVSYKGVLKTVWKCCFLSCMQRKGWSPYMCFFLTVGPPNLHCRHC